MDDLRGWGDGAPGYPNQMMNAVQGGNDAVAPVPGQAQHGGGQGVGVVGQCGQSGTPPAPNAPQGQPATHGGGQGGHHAQIGACVAEVCWTLHVGLVLHGFVL